MELARQASSSSSAHPFALFAAASAASISPEMIQAMTASVLLQQQRPQVPLLTYLNPGSDGSQGITPIIPTKYYIGSPRPQTVPDEFMPQSATKRTIGDDEEGSTPKTKAKCESKRPRHEE